MLSVAINLDGVEPAAEHFEAVARSWDHPLRPILDEIANDWIQAFRENLDRNRFTPLAPATIAIRRQRGQSGDRPLLVRGDLRESIRKTRVSNDSLEIGAARPFLQSGFTTSSRSAIPNRRVPGRPFLLLSREEATSTIDKVTRTLLCP